ncbi:MFS transporter [Ornithinimicrobium sp. Y1847]|uniref:MFS transporter n=1 Tax=Ornithinimicrobium sp. Y1847 TaxID=3405419 RepID=UPI003B679DDA
MPAPHATPPPLGRRFGAHLSAVGLANLADGLVATAVPLIAISLTRSPALIGLLTAAVWVPWLVLGLPAGVLVDRWDRRRTMVVALSIRALLLGAAAVLALTGQLTIWWLVGLALTYGITEVFTDLAAQAQVPALVGRRASTLQRANARLLAVEQIAGGFIGPPLAGVLVAAGAAWALGVPGALVIGAAVTLLVGLGGRYVATRPEQTEVTTALGRVSEGMVILWRHPVLRPMLIGGGMWNFASAGFAAVIVLWLVGPGSAGGLSERTYSLVLVAMPVGAVIGSWLAGRVLARFTEMRVLVVCWGVNAVLNVVPLLWPGALGFALFLFLVAPLGVVGNVISGSIRPRMVPEHVLGKVGGAARVVGYGTMPIGAVVAGQAAERFGIEAVLCGVVVIMLLATALVAVQVPQRLVDEHELEPEERAAESQQPESGAGPAGKSAQVAG